VGRAATLDISCGCFSTSSAGKISYVTLIRAIVITLLSAAAYAGTILQQPKQWQLPAAEPEPEGDLQAEDIVSRLELLPARE